MILAGNRISRLFLNSIVGDIVDRYGCRGPLIAGLLIKAVSVTGYALALYSPIYPGFIFFSARFLYGIGAAFGFITTYAFMFHLTKEKNRGSRTAYIRTAGLFGFPAGLALGGLISNYYNFSTAFFFSASALFIFTTVAFFMIPDLEAKEKAAGIGPIEAVRIAISDGRVLRISLVNLFEWFSVQGVFLATTALYVEHYGIQVFGLGADGMSGLLMAVMMLSKGISTFLIGRVIDGAETRTSFSLIGASLGGLAFLLWAAFPNLPSIAIGLLLLGACSGIMSSPLLALLGDVSKEELRGRTLGVYQVFGDIGGTLGPVFGINVAAILGFRIMYSIVAVVMFCTLISIYSLHKIEVYTKRTVKQAETV